MASETIAYASKQRGFLATPSYLRLWFAGGIGNAMRWLELLVAGIFTYEVTQSTVLVSLVIVARSLPMLLIGTIAGVVGEALNRKRLLLTQRFVLAVSSAVLCVLAFSGQIQVWHVALALRAHRIERLQQQRAKQFLRRNRRPSQLGVQLLEFPRQCIQRLVHNL